MSRPLSEREGVAFFKHLKDRYGWKALKGGRKFASGFVYARPECFSTNPPAKLNVDFYLSELFVGAVNNQEILFATELASWRAEKAMNDSKKRARDDDDEVVELQTTPPRASPKSKAKNQTQKPVRLTAKKSRKSSNVTPDATVSEPEPSAIEEEAAAIATMTTVAEIPKLFKLIEVTNAEASTMWNSRVAIARRQNVSIENDLAYLETIQGKESIRMTVGFCKRISDMMDQYKLDPEAGVEDMIAHLTEKLRSTENAVKTDIKCLLQRLFLAAKDIEAAL